MFKILITEEGVLGTEYSILRNDINEFVTFDNLIAARRTCDMLHNVNTRKFYHPTEMD
jgi:hypothetical protein